MKRVTAVLIVYAILVIASSIFWVWYALSKSSLTAGNNIRNVNRATDADKKKQSSEFVNDKATDLTGRDAEGAKTPG
jgi:hypothetical protein